MTQPFSIRFREKQLLVRLKDEAGARATSTSALAEQLIDEGLRTRRHPLIVFRDGASGRRAVVAGGPDVWEVMGYLVGSDVAPAKRVAHAADQLGIPRHQVEAALNYYAEFTEEIDDRIKANIAAADEAEALWRKRNDLLSK